MRETSATETRQAHLAPALQQKTAPQNFMEAPAWNGQSHGSSVTQSARDHTRVSSCDGTRAEHQRDDRQYLDQRRAPLEHPRAQVIAERADA
jgi:hypothetical protein